MKQVPVERNQTVRQQLLTLLEEDVLGVRELSQHLQITEKEVYSHLEHIERGVKASGKRLRVEPARCLYCDFVFEDRTRKKTPGKCPVCRKTRIQRPQFTIVSSST
ncbi:hypothetical protein [Desulfobulbus japonicus]